MSVKKKTWVQGKTHKRINKIAKTTDEYRKENSSDYRRE